MTAALTDTAPASMLDRFTAIIDAFEDTSAGLTLDQIAARAHLPPARPRTASSTSWCDCSG